MSLPAQLVLVSVFAAATGWTVGVLKLEEVLMTSSGGRFETSRERRAETFLVSFGLSKAACNYVAGKLADMYGRRPVMLAGWLAALTVSPAVLYSWNWELVVAADILLGANQAFCWSTSIFIALDLLGAWRLALGLGPGCGSTTCLVTPVLRSIR